MYFKYFIIPFLYFISINITTGQNKTSLKKNYLWFDNQVGIENTGLFNGLRYEEKYRMTNSNHKFYRSRDYLVGDIIYDNQTYYNIKMKYDIFENHVIVNLVTNTGNNILKLLNSKLEGFSISENEFTKISNSTIQNSNNKMNGFFEVLFKEPTLILYKKYKKKAKKNINKKYLYFTFKNENKYYCYNINNYYLIKSKKDWINIFPNQKKLVLSFYNENKILQKSNYDSFLKQLCKKLNNSIVYNTSLN